MKPLFIPLKTEFFEAFKNGTKDTEYRVYGPRWNEKTCKEGRPVTLSKGYGKKHRLQGVITAFETSITPTTTAEWKSCYPPRIPRQIAACIKIQVAQGNKPNAGGLWQWFESEERDPLTLRLTYNGAEVATANDDEPEGSPQYYWEQTPTDKLSMPGRWLKCTA